MGNTFFNYVPLHRKLELEGTVEAISIFSISKINRIQGAVSRLSKVTHQASGSPVLLNSTSFYC